MSDSVHGRPDLLLIFVAEEAQEAVGSPPQPAGGQSPAITFVGFETPPEPEPAIIPSSDLDLFG